MKRSFRSCQLNPYQPSPSTALDHPNPTISCLNFILPRPHDRVPRLAPRGPPPGPRNELLGLPPLDVGHGELRDVAHVPEALALGGGPADDLPGRVDDGGLLVGEGGGVVLGRGALVLPLAGARELREQPALLGRGRGDGGRLRGVRGGGVGVLAAFLVPCVLLLIPLLLLDRNARDL